MTPAFRKLLAKKYTQRALLEDYINWAMAELEAGLDTPNLRILAGLHKPPYWPDIEFHFERTLDELKVVLPPREQFLKESACHIAHEIVLGSLSPEEGCAQIYDIYISLDYSGDLGEWSELHELMFDDYLIKAYALDNVRVKADIIIEAHRLLESDFCKA